MRDRAAAESVTDKLLAPLSSNADISFEAAIGAIVTQRGDWQYTASRFVKQDHVYRRLVMIILSAFSAGDDQVDKIAPLKKEWEQIQPNSWEARLRDGDRQAWYEMLLGIYLGQKEIDEARILVDLGTPEAFKSSTFINLNFTRQGMLCEFEFYRSLRSRAAGKLDDWRAGLRRTTATEKGNYWEYAMADFLLSEPTR
jgi:hypothetical protein